MVESRPHLCAFCYKRCSANELENCASCKKRKYCSRGCQRIDWSDAASARGQRHKLFCRLGCGEEGHDWEVRRIDEVKGLGVVALRDFERGDRILAERILDKRAVLNKSALSPTERSALEDLMPKGGTMLEKLNTNALSTDEGGGICVRLIDYNTASIRQNLTKRNIHCLPSCKCHDQELAAKVKEAQDLYEELKLKAMYVCGGTPVPRSKLDRLTALVEELELSHQNVSAVCYAGYSEYLCRGDKVNALRYAQKSLDMNRQVYGPKAESVEYDSGLVREAERM